MVLDTLGLVIQEYKKIEDKFIEDIEKKYGLKFDKNYIFSVPETLSDKSVYINFKSPGCKACKKGIDTYFDFLSLKCNMNCFFCFRHKETTRDVLKGAIIANGVIKNNPAIRNVAIGGGEPLLQKREVLEFINKIYKHNHLAYKRLYTNGLLVDEQILQKLKEAHLEELRFSIRVDDSEEMKNQTFQKVKLAKQYIPKVIVEMHIIPKTFSQSVYILDQLEKIGIDGVNIIEFFFLLQMKKNL